MDSLAVSFLKQLITCADLHPADDTVTSVDGITRYMFTALTEWDYLEKEFPRVTIKKVNKTLDGIFIIVKLQKVKRASDAECAGNNETKSIGKFARQVAIDNLPLYVF